MLWWTPQHTLQYQFLPSCRSRKGRTFLQHFGGTISSRGMLSMVYFFSALGTVRSLNISSKPALQLFADLDSAVVQTEECFALWDSSEGFTIRSWPTRFQLLGPHIACAVTRSAKTMAPGLPVWSCHCYSISRSRCTEISVCNVRCQIPLDFGHWLLAKREVLSSARDRVTSKKSVIFFGYF